MNDLPPALKRATVWLLAGTLVFLAVQAWLDRQQRTRFEVHGDEIRLRRAADGHYHWPGQVDGRPVEFLVDTGATRSALPLALAQALRLPAEGTVRSQTAGGTVQGTVVRADLSLDGGLHVERLRIVALPELHAPLLGMDVLGRLHWRQSDGLLIVDLSRGARRPLTRRGPASAHRPPFPPPLAACTILRPAAADAAMIDTASLSKLVPGFDFLQNMMQSAGQSMPMGQWVAPTLDPAEIDKRVSELKTVQFWLEQNARMIGTTIQALEVQRMTLNTLQTMNLPIDELRQAMTLPQSPASASAPKPAAEKRRAEPAPAPAPAAGAKPAVDPMQWWGALTQQFGELAQKALQDSSALAAQALSGAAPAGTAPPKPAPKTKAAAKAAGAPAAPGEAAPKKAPRRRTGG